MTGAPMPRWTGLVGLLELRDRIEVWLPTQPWIEAAALFGSTEHAQHPADDWSDLDVLLVVRDPAAVIEDDAWPAGVGEAWISLVHEAPIPGVQVRQVVYAPGHDVDWIVVDRATVEGIPPEAWDEVAGNGSRVVVDRDGWLQRQVARARPTVGLPTPDEATFTWTVDDFLYQVVWTTKRLCRGELWRAKDDIDRYEKAHLLTVIGWQAMVRRPGVTVRPEGRGMDGWIVPATAEALPTTFAAWDPVDMGRATLATLDLFGRVARDVAQAHGWAYPEERHAVVHAWVEERLAEVVASPAD
jgi:aminoglycoside 6-adenylyltransferase